ncbi:MAG: hypothetical protein ACOH5I_09000 [Oligoflexus sp.]
MRSLLLATTIALSQFSPAFSAEFGDEETWTDEQDYEERQYGWNQWVCSASAPGYFQPFYGWSYFFREGSGEGQQARSLAHLSALRNCEFRSGRQCHSRLESDCYVRRY